MKADAATPSEKPKIPLPTVSQINADRITQVRIKFEVKFIIAQCLLIY